MLKAVLVDLDGTLVDSEHANAAAYAAALAEIGIAVESAELVRIITGRAWRDFLPGLMVGSNATPASVAHRKRALYPDHFHLIRVNLAVVDLVRAVRGGGLATALVTTAASVSTQAILARFDLRALFDVLICGDDVACAKPDPEGYWLAARRFGLRAEECMVIEDSDTGMAAALAFGGHVLRWGAPGMANGLDLDQRAEA